MFRCHFRDCKASLTHVGGVIKCPDLCYLGRRLSCDLGEAVSSFYSLQTVEDGLLVFSQDNKGLDTL